MVARDKNEYYKFIQTLEYIDDEIADAYLDIFTEELLCKISIYDVDFNCNELCKKYICRVSSISELKMLTNDKTLIKKIM